MVFNSIDYIIFLPTVIILTFLVPNKFRWISLLISSYIFYMWWNPAYAVLIFASTIVDYFVGLNIHKTADKKIKKILLSISLITNLGLLFSFKYFNFFNEILRGLLLSFGINYRIEGLNFLLPVGISFYTFQTLSYTIDVYRNKLKPTNHFGIFALYVSFFPQLVAGPIERAWYLIPQFKNRIKFKSSVLNDSVARILFGLFKKVIIADRIALYVDAVYGNISSHSSFSLLLATYFFAIQIYCDFSAYSDIAIGSARLFGIRLRENFNSPYLATSITDFWRRWHISLSSWLRDYLYISLGGNRKGSLRTYYNLIIVMLLGGLWHGAGWNFIIWGGLHGGFLVIERIFKNINGFSSKTTFENNDGSNIFLNRTKNIISIWFRRIIVFHLVCLAWIFFRSGTLDSALNIIFGICEFNSGFFFDYSIFSHLAFGAVIGVALLKSFSKIKNKEVTLTGALNFIFFIVTIILCIILFGVEQGSAFIYFKF